MRKVIWCCAAAGVLAASSFLSLAYYACRCPNSLVGRSMQVIAEASIAMQPMSSLTSMAVRTSRANAPAHAKMVPIDESIPDDPQPVALERKEEEMIRAQNEEEMIRAQKEEEFLEQRNEIEPEAAPIVIDEDDPMPREQAETIVPATLEMADMPEQEIPSKGCPIVMPYCRDDDAEPMPPKMSRAEGSEKAEPSVFKAWIELFAEGKENAPTVEELPPPKEEDLLPPPASTYLPYKFNKPQDEPKCQEDRHLHEHYPGCPRTTCPYPSKDQMEQYLKRGSDLGPKMKKKGGEESSEDPPHSEKKEECPRTKGVDTMEYRKSDAGPDEYGPGPLH